MRSQDISDTGRKYLFRVCYSDKMVLYCTGRLSLSIIASSFPLTGQLGATVTVSKALMSWNLLQEKLTSSCFVPLLLGLTSKCICELCLAFKGGTLQRRSKGTGQFWSGPSAGFEKHPRVWRTGQGLHSPACKGLSTLHPQISFPGSWLPSGSCATI